MSDVNWAKEGRKGGKKTLELYGREHFRKASNARWKKLKAKKKKHGRGSKKAR